jgi:hypothetical protein
MLAIEGIATDPNFDRYEIEYGTGDAPTIWTRIFPLTPGEEAQSQTPKQGVLANWDVTQLARGTYTLCLKVFDKGGNATCHRVTFTLQGGVSLQNVRTNASLISPNADGELDSAEVSFTLDVAASITARVYPVLGGERQTVPVRTLLANAQHLAGENTLLWDGITDLGAAAADGVYDVVLTAVDACGFARSETVRIEVDRAPPTASLDSPAAGETNRVLIEIRGTAADAHFSAYELAVGTGTDPATWVTIATGRSPLVTPGLLGQWNDRGQAGAYTIRLIATDTAGNRTEIRRLITVTATDPLITSLAGQPLIVSPNGDERQDVAVIDYVIAAAAHVAVEVLSGDSVVDTITPEYEAAPGAHAATWRALMAPGDPFDDGEYVVRIIATSTADAGRVHSEQITVTVDTTPPAITVDAPVEGGFVRGDIGVQGSVVDAHLQTYAVRYGTAASGPIVALDEGAQSRTAHTFGSLTDLADGSYVIQITASDLAQNTTVLTRSFVSDGGSPAVALTSPEAGAVAGGGVSTIDVRGTVTEPNLQNWTLRFGAGLTPASWTTLVTQTTGPTSDALAIWDTAALSDGIYTLSLVALDRAGGSSEARAHVLVDHTAPVAAIRQPVHGGRVTAPTAIRGDAIDANFTSATLELSQGPASEAYEFAPLATLSGPVADGVLFEWQSLPADGVYTLRLTVLDDAGQRAEHTSTIVIDTEPPAAPTGLVATLQNGRNAHLTWTSSADAALAGYHVYRGGQRLTSTPVAVPTFVDASLNDGTHRYTVTAVDAGALQSGHSNEASVLVDLTPPVANIQAPANGALVSDLIDLRGTASSAADFLDYQVLVAEGASPLDSAFTVVRHSPAPVISGVLAQIDTLGRPAGSVLTVRLIARDLSGNISTDQVALTIDNQQPAAPVLLSAVATGSTVNITWQGVADGDLAGYLLYNNSLLANARRYVAGNTTPYLLTGSSFADQGLADGDYQYSIVAVDGAGNMSAPSNSLTATVETRAPRATIVSPANASRADSPVALLATTPDIDVASVRFQYQPQADPTWIDLGAPATSAPYTATWDPRPLATGTYQFRAIATDIRGNVDATPPVVTIVHADVTSPAPPVNLTALVDAGTVSLNWNPSPSDDVAQYAVHRQQTGQASQQIGTTIAAVTAFQDPGVPDGAYLYTIEALDAALNRSDRSNTASALVYTPLLNASNTCLATPTAAVTGAGAAAGATVTLFATIDGVSTPVAMTIAAPDGSFQFINVPLSSGVNEFTAEATDVSGNRSRRSAAAEFVFGGAVGVPSGVSASVNGTEVTLTWTAAANAFSYRIVRDGESINITSGTSFVDTGVPEGRRRYAVIAINACDVEGGPATLEVPVGDVAAPAAPGGLTAEVNGANVTLRWTASTEADFSFYAIHRQSGGGDWTSVGGTVDPQFIDGDVPNGAHRYRVTAFDDKGNESDPSNEVAVVVDQPVPLAPTSLTVVAPGNGGALDLSWSAAAAGPAPAFYAVYRALSAGGPYQPVMQPDDPEDLLLVEATTWRDTSVTNGVTYYYVVRAVDLAFNQSEPSNEASGTPLDTMAPDPPLLLSPTDAAHPITVSVSTATVGGVAEPGSTVSLLRDGITLGSTLVGEDRVLEEFSIDALAWFDRSDAAFHSSGLAAMFVERRNPFRIMLVVQDVRTRETRSFQVESPGEDLIFTPDGSKIVYSQYGFIGPEVNVFDLTTGAIVHNVPLPDIPDGMAVSPDGERMVLGLYDPDVGDTQMWLLTLASGALERLTEAASGVDDFAWSPDGGTVFYSSGSDVMRMTLPDRSTAVLDTDFDGDLVLSPDGVTLAYTVSRDGRISVRLQNLATGAITALAPVDPDEEAVEQESPVFSPDGSMLLTTERASFSSDSQVWQRRLGTSEATLVMEDPPEDPFWMRDRSIVFWNDLDIIRLTAPGEFAFDGVAIEPGLNRFSAIAVDASGHASQPAEPILLTRSTSGLSDLAAAAEDLFLYPALPAPGQQVRIAATIRNLGDVAADQVSVTVLDIDETGTAEVVGSPQSFATLGAGAQAAIAVDWTAGAGRHRLQVVVDPLGAVTEVSESNNRAERVVDVGVPGTAAVRVAVDQPAYDVAATARFVVSATNPTAATAFTLEITIEDALGQTASMVLQQSLTPFAYASRDVAASWPVTGALAGDYRVRATLKGTDGQVVTAAAPFSILADEHVTVALSTDRAAYTDGETVRLAGVVRNTSTNVDLSDLSSLIEVLGPGGESVHQANSTLGTLLIGAQAAASATWHAASPGSYVARLTVKHGAGVLGQTERSFTVNGTARVGGALAVARPSVPLGEPFNVSATLSNTGSVGADGLVARLRVIDPTSQTTIRTFERTVDLAAGASVPWPVEVSSVGLEIKAYRLSLALERQLPAVETLAAATTTVNVLDVIAPAIQIVSPVPNLFSNDDVTVFARVSDTSSAVARVEISVDGGQWQVMGPADPAAGTFSYVLGAAAATEGFHTLAVRAIDAAGNDDGTSATDTNPATLPITIDVTSPAIVVSGVADGQRYGNAVTPTVVVNDANLVTSSITLNGAPFVSGTEVASAGTHVLRVSANDRAGNTSETTVGFTLAFGGPPVAADQLVTTPEDTPVPVVLSATDPDAEPLTFVLVASPAHGTLTGSAPNLTYTPAPDFHGSDEFTFQASDASSASNVATVRLQVTPVNDRPAASAGSNQAVDEGTSVTLDGSASSDVDGDVLAYAWSQIEGAPATLDLANPARPVFAAPEVSRDGSRLTFELVVNDGALDSAPSRVSVLVANVNKPPRIEDQTQTTDEDVPVSWTLDVIDPDDDGLTYEVGAPAHGTVTGAPPDLTYTPERDFHGVDQFTVTVRDVAGLSGTGTITLSVRSVNDRPTAHAGADAAVFEGDAVMLDGTASGDVDGDSLTYAWTQVAGPAVTLGGANTARPDFIAPDVARGGSTLTFRLLVADLASVSDPAFVNITVKNTNHTPVAEAGPAQRVGGGVTVTLDGSLSYDPDSDPLTYEWRQTAGMAVTLLAGSTAHPSFVAPIVGVQSVLTFELTVSDGLASAADRVDVTVDPVNQRPTADAGADQSVHEGDTVTLDGRGSRDPDGNPLTYRWTQVGGAPVTLSDHTLAQPQFAAPQAGPSGERLIFELVVSDGLLDSAADRVIVDVLGDAHPPICTNATANPSRLWPPNHAMVPISITGLVHGQGAGAEDRIALQILGVTQDEPTEGTGDGDTGPDAVIDGDAVSLRAERAGSGSGRVYTIRFTASAGQNGSCTGSVTVEVPHQANKAAVDDGQTFDSTRSSVAASGNGSGKKK